MVGNQSWRWLASAAVLAAAAFGASSAMAQAAPSDGTELEAVIVTAQRVSEDIQKVPVSVTAISGEKLDVIRSGGGDIRMLSSRVPSLTLESSFGRTFPRPYIRGLGNTDFDLNASQPVSIVYDDVVLENPIVKGFPIFDIAQVEVLRGPQGTLFGRNTPAGVLKFDSVKPGDSPDGYASASYATYGTTNLEGAIGGPIVKDILSARFSALYQSRDDWVDNTFTGQKNASEGYQQYAFRGQLLWTPTENISALLNLHYMKLDGTPRLFRANIIKPGTNDFVDGFEPDKIAQDAQPRAFQNVEIKGGSLKLNFDFGGPTLTSITGFEKANALSRADVDGGYGAVFAPPSGPGIIPFPSESADGLPYHQQFSQELRLAGDVDRLKYQVGGFYFFEDVKIDSFNYDTLAGGTLNGYARQHQKTESWALFGNLSYAVTDKLTVSGGVRYSNDKKDFTAEQTMSPIGAPPTGVLRLAPKSDDVSWNINATYEASPDINLYGRIAKGYRAPSIQGRLLFGSTLSMADTETAISYEAGFKAYAFDRRLRLNVGAFYYSVDNLQLTAVGGGANFNRLVNAKKADGFGMEFDVEARPIERLLLTAGLSYNHTEIDDRLLTVGVCGSGCTVTDPTIVKPDGTRLAFIDGNPLPNAPRWIGNVTAGYSIPVGAGEVFFFTDWAYRSRVNFFLYQSVEYSDDRLVEGGLRIGYRAPGERWEAAVFGRNITDDRSLEGGIDFNNLTGFINEPRTWGVQLKAKFF